jgi:hypothetical protein
LLKANAALGRLNVTTANGDTDGDGDFDRLFAFGARSFSIWTEAGEQVFDSGADIERHWLHVEVHPTNPTVFVFDQRIVAANRIIHH